MTRESAVQFATSSRIHMGLAVKDLGRSVAFYQTLFGQGPTKTRPGYAKFEVADPPLVLSLEPARRVTGTTLNHLGLRMVAPEALVDVQRRLEEHGFATRRENGVACCYARQDKVWVDGPSGEPWEIYTVLEDVEMPAGQLRTVDPETGAACCATVTEDGTVSANATAACC